MYFIFFFLLTFFFINLFLSNKGSKGSIFFNVFSIFLSFLISLFIFYEVGLLHINCYVNLFPWLSFSNISIYWSFCYDTLSSIMLIFILFVSLCANFYSVEYMMYDPHKIRFFSYLSLFTFTMLMLVTSNNLIQLFFGWKSVGISSYLLINFWYTRIQAKISSILSIMSNKVIDVLLLFSCLFLLYFNNISYYKKKNISFKCLNLNVNKASFSKNLRFKLKNISYNRDVLFSKKKIIHRNYTLVKYDHKEIKFVLKNTYFSCFSGWFDDEYISDSDIFFNLKYNNNFITEHEKNMITEWLLNKQLSLYNSETPSSSYYSFLNDNIYIFYFDYNNNINNNKDTVYLGGICIIDIEKTYITYKKKKYYFYRVYYIQDDYIKISLTKEDENVRYYDSHCPIIVKFFYPTFTDLKKFYNIDNAICEKIVSKIENKKGNLISKKKLDPLFQKFSNITLEEDRKYNNNFDLPKWIKEKYNL